MSNPAPNKAIGLRRYIGLTLLAGTHLVLLGWSFALGLFKPRYRRIARFQWRYFRDVFKQELARDKSAT